MDHVVLLASGLFAGTLGGIVGTFVVLRMSDAAYRSLIDALMLCSGLSLLWVAVR